MAEALEKVKKDLGREAVILHTRTVRRGGWLGFGARMVVEITASRNVLRDLTRQAEYKRARSAATATADLRGVSYEINAYMNWTTRKTERSVLRWVHKASAFGLRGQVFGPSDIYLIFDGDRKGPNAKNNYPDPNDNHGADGVNMQMCDGSAKWVKGGRRYLLAYEISQDENRSAP